MLKCFAGARPKCRSQIQFPCLVSSSQTKQHTGKEMVSSEVFNFTLQQYTITHTGQHPQKQIGCYCDTVITARLITMQCNCCLLRQNISMLLFNDLDLKHRF